MQLQDAAQAAIVSFIVQVCHDVRGVDLCVYFREK
jgi:hypothetical protein